MKEWNYKAWQKRFFDQQRRIEIELDLIRKYKVKSNPSYKRFHDEELGKLLLFTHLETHESLVSKDKFIIYLEHLYETKPHESNQAYDQDIVANSWKIETKRLIEHIGDINEY
ncbi:hypothetical protein V8050_004460 [Vibrio parahaemolyticus]|nr:hypothetical protein [Vibrio parahaemolyticus]EJG0711740.1 hypothetical protein [Vibrio parahaemolyticus]ELB2967014.1 hypothetical protein [Vibrio parahaemolyticus]HAS6746071.1 hypothetical protein [Vibrio parahaemolyticus]HAS6765983.1 hypothetical protein [Vibrio parahaemolyticus]